MLPHLKLRPGIPADLEGALEVLEEAENFLASRSIQQWKPGVHRPYADQFRAALENGLFHVVDDGGEVAGMFALKWSDQRFWVGQPAAEAGYVSKLAIRRRLAGQGLGLWLLREAERMARERGKAVMRLDCWAENPVICAYYERAGYVSQGEIDAPGVRLRLYQRSLLSE